MASTTKVMTALLAIEQGNLEDPVTCSANAFGVSGTSIYLQEGETLSLRQMLLGLMLASGNDAAVAIAEHIGGSVEGFAQMMNARARQIGAMHTHFVNPHGLPHEQHYTTAYDLALIAREAMGNQAFREIVSTASAKIPWMGRAYERQLRNKNRLLSSYDGATGIKTGYTSRAGRCLVFGAAREGMELIGVVLGCADWFDEAERLLNGCFDTYDMVRVLAPAQLAGRLSVQGGQSETVDLCVMQTLDAPLCEGEAAQVVLDVPQALSAPIYPGMHVGSAHLVIAGQVVDSCEVVASEAVGDRGMRLDVRRIVACWPL